MKDVIAAVIARLMADSDISAQVGTRIYQTNFPTGATFPCITVSSISEIPDVFHCTGGVVSADSHQRIQCSIFAQTNGLERFIGKLISDSLNALHDTTLSYGSSGTVKVISCIDLGGVPGSTVGEISSTSTTGLYVEHRDFRIYYDPN